MVAFNEEDQQQSNNRAFGTMKNSERQGNSGEDFGDNGSRAANGSNKTSLGAGENERNSSFGGFASGRGRGRGGGRGGSSGSGREGSDDRNDNNEQQQSDDKAFGAKKNNERQGNNGDDFGDKRNRAATGANTAPLGDGGGGEGGGFGGRGRGRGGGRGDSGGGRGGSFAGRDRDTEDNGFGGGRDGGSFGGRGRGRGGGRGDSSNGSGGGRGGSFGGRDRDSGDTGFGGGRGGSFGGRGGSFGGRDRDAGDNGFGGGRGGSFGGRDRDAGDNRFVGGRGGSFGGRDRDAGDNRFGGGRGGSFGGRDREASDNRFGGGNDRPGFRPYETEEERARNRSHVPKDRSLEEIFGEDTKVSYQYKGIREEDEEVTVTGLGPEMHQQMLDTWEDANFEPKLKENIDRATYIRPRKIQSLTIPLIMDGHDIKGHAETGSGKSAAFLLPIINTIIVKKKNNEYESKRICPYALIIEPTRELAIQLYEQARKLADGTGVSVSVAYGKFTRNVNIREISTRGCDILIGTTGRLVDFFSDSLLEFEKMKILVLDEADQLLEDSFARDLRQLSRVNGWPKNEDRQTLLFSATFPPEVQEWANDWLKKENVMVSNTKLVDANTRVMQNFMKVTRADKNNELLKMLRKEEEEARTENPADPPVKRTMVFVKMKRTADVVSTFLNVHDLKSTTINGDRPQQLREKALNEFRQGKHNIVVTTDVCARGIDIKDLDHVINLDLPTDYVTYVHRIGRTGRLKEGTATSFFDPLEDMDLADELVKGTRNANQVPPDWLVQAAEGKLPMDEQTSMWGGGFNFGTDPPVPTDKDESKVEKEENSNKAENDEEEKNDDEEKKDADAAGASNEVDEAADQTEPPPVVPVNAGEPTITVDAENDEW